MMKDAAAAIEYNMMHGLGYVCLHAILRSLSSE